MFKWERIGHICHQAIISEELNLSIVIEEPIYFDDVYLVKLSQGSHDLFSCALPAEINTLDEAKEHAGFALFCAAEKEIQMLKTMQKLLNEGSKNDEVS